MKACEMLERLRPSIMSAAAEPPDIPAVSPPSLPSAAAATAADTRATGSQGLQELLPNESWEPRENLSETESRAILLERVRDIIAMTKAQGQVLNTGYFAHTLLSVYPAAGLTVRQVVDELARAAIIERIPIKLTEQK
jgi:hypothetical protein